MSDINLHTCDKAPPGFPRQGECAACRRAEDTAWKFGFLHETIAEKREDFRTIRQAYAQGLLDGLARRGT